MVEVATVVTVEIVGVKRPLWQRRNSGDGLAVVHCRASMPFSSDDDCSPQNKRGEDEEQVHWRDVA